MMTKKEKVKQILIILRTIFPVAFSELNYEKDYEFLFAVIMSAQTTDKQVNKLTEKLFKKYSTLESIAKANLEEFTSDISSIGLFRAKAKNIIKAANILIEKYNSKVPSNMEDLILIPGVGRKTANVVTHHLFETSYGIAVDTHVGRLSYLLGLTKSHDPKVVEKDLMKITPKKDWGDFSNLLILYGRRYWSANNIVHNGPLSVFADPKVTIKWSKDKKISSNSKKSISK
jgi:endonuclease-3